MDDLEMTKLCAEAMDFVPVRPVEPLYGGGDDISNWAWWCRTKRRDDGPLFIYAPLHEDAQVMALVKKLRIDTMSLDENHWYARRQPEMNWGNDAPNLNRAIVVCAANVQLAKSPTHRVSEQSAG